MEDEHDYIEKYLKGELSTSEKDDFEAKILLDPELKNQVEAHRSLLRGLTIGFNRELKSLLMNEEKIQRKNDSKVRTKTKSLYYFLGIAAVIILLVVAIFTIKDTPIETEQLFVQNYQTYPNVEAPISRSDINEENAYHYYEQGKYKQAIGLFSTMNKENPLDPAPLFYTGICHLELQNAEASASYFELVLKLEENKYSRPALWYGALSNIKLERKAKAMEFLSQLATGDDNYAKKSQLILQKLSVQ